MCLGRPSLAINLHNSVKRLVYKLVRVYNASMTEMKTERITTMMTPSEVKALDDWAFANRIRSRGEAIRRLIEAGLTKERGGQSGSGSGGSGQPVRKSASPPPNATAPKPRSAPTTSSKPLSKEQQLRALREQGAR